MQTITQTRLLGLKTVAEITGLAQYSLRAMCRKGRLPGAFKFGHNYKISEADLAKYLADLKGSAQA